MRTADEDRLQIGGALDQCEGVSTTPEPEGCCHLVVAGAPGVHAAADIAQLSDQLALDQGMHILVGGAGVDRDRIECLHDRGGVIRRNDSLASKHPGMRLRGRNVVRQ